MVATTRRISWVAVATTVGFVGCATPTVLPGDVIGNDNPTGNHGEPTLEYDDLSQPPTNLNDMGVADLTSANVTDLEAAPPDLLTPPDLMPPPVTNIKATDVCAGAPLLPAGVTITNQDSTPWANDYDFSVSASAACSVFSQFTYPGGDGAYRFSIPAGKTLTVVLTSSWDGALAILTNCAKPGPSCLSGSDGTGSTETVSYKNTGAAALDVYVLVDAYSFFEYGKFSIRADLN